MVEIIRNRDRRQKQTGTMWKGFESLMTHYEFHMVGEENLTLVRNNCLKSLNERNLPLSIVDLYRHSAGDDPILTLAVLHSSLGDILGETIFPVSDYYSNFFKFPTYAAQVGIAQMLRGVEVVKITQPYRTRDLSLNGAQLAEINNQSGDAAKIFGRILLKGFKTGASEAIAPESHRSPWLLPAEKGAGASVEILLRKNLPANILSTAIVYQEGYSRTLNFDPFKRTPVTVYIDKPLTPEEVRAETEIFANNHGLKTDDKNISSLMSHYLMIRMRGMLPENMWGVYDEINHPELFNRVIHDEIKLGIWPDGNIGLIDMVSWKPFKYSPFSV